MVGSAASLRGSLYGAAWAVTALALVAVIGSGPADAEAAKRKRPDLVVAAIDAPGAAIAGSRIKLTALVKNAGKATAKPSSASITLLLDDGTTLAAGPSKAVAKLKRRKGKKFGLSATVPAGTESGLTFVAQVCADAKRAVKESKESNNCRQAGDATVTDVAEGGLGLLDAERASGAITEGVWALRTMQFVMAPGDLPSRYVIPAPDTSSSGVIRDVAALYPELSADERSAIDPYFAPPGLRDAVVVSASGSSATRRLDCNAIFEEKYRGISAAGGKVVVWYQTDQLNMRPSAERLAGYVTEAWNKLVPQFKEPKSDAALAAAGNCFGGVDGRYDVYLYQPNAIEAAVADLGTTIPTGIASTEAGVGTCTNTPATTLIRFANHRRFTTAHELMHAIQFAYKYKECASKDSWWDEGGANWAGDWVYPDDQDEHKYLYFGHPQGELWAKSYGASPFWTMLTEDNGVGIINSIFAQLATRTDLAAVNAAVPGGLRKQFPRYLQFIYNRPPQGEPGFPIATDNFLYRDGINEQAPRFLDTNFSMNGLSERTITTPIADEAYDLGCPVGQCLEALGGSYQWFVPNSSVRELKLTNPLAGNSNAHVEGWVKLADGTWDVQDYSGKGSVTFCRDKPEENLQEMILVTSNVSSTGAGVQVRGVKYTWRGRDQCPPPESYSGTFSSRMTQASPPEYEVRFLNGTVTFANRVAGGLGANFYTVTSGTATFTIHYVANDTGCDIDGTTPVSFAPSNFGQSGSLNVYGGVLPPYSALMTAPIDAKVTVTSSGCTDPADDGKTSEIPIYGFRPLLIPKAGTANPVGTKEKVLAGTTSYSEGIQQYEFTWDLRPPTAP